MTAPIAARLFACAWFAASLGAAAAALPADAALDQRVQALQGESLQLERELRGLEDELLYPSGTGIAVFVSADLGPAIELDDVSLSLDGQVVASHGYTALERRSLRRGAIQRLYGGSIGTGKHALAVTLVGHGPGGVGFKRDARFEFAKEGAPRGVELHLKDGGSAPEIEVKVWP
ncbi:MAG: AraC family transcriptional regulator [Burkholderiales bacterium]|nr:AraC family transcriptional regulator [Burkholderiales bacterium]MDE1929110.1 AraC family transcriptional regulator [Burkholderiales bacterium]MDE2159936.1 AraC family transcriptional regulator [Burkholderiales bacterium]MDE2503617.1 AraC family transcriptional regulator [Burkholderiales bacterium]